jgi:SAM-dependent methyltransferase
MSAATAQQLHGDEAVRAFDMLCRMILNDRFMPMPPSERHFIGDGDFRAIGVEFLRHFVTVGGLKPSDAVLEIGCGIGRMALPLTRYLTYPEGHYDGVDIVADGIGWCTHNITPSYDNFRFAHLDFYNEIYNPHGRPQPELVALPFLPESFDFIIMTSVFTHLLVPQARSYVNEIKRLLRPGGRCFATAFLMNDAARAGLKADRRRLPFPTDTKGPEFFADPANPCGAVAFEEAFFLDLLAKTGLKLLRPIDYGQWNGRKGTSYQDICLIGRKDAP